MNATGACLNCKFFLSIPTTDKDGIGECHRFPPRTDALLLGVGKGDQGQPIPQFSMVVTPAKTSVTNWCGEYQKGLVIPTADEMRGPSVSTLVKGKK